MFFEISNPSRSLLLVAALLAPVAVAEPPTAVARAVAADLSAGRLPAVAARFEGKMAALLPEAKLREVWSGLLARTGALKSAGEPRETPMGGVTVVVVPLVFERAALDMKVSVAPAGGVVGLFFAPAEAPPTPWSPPAYADAKAFREDEVTVGKAPWALPGTLALPLGARRVPAVVLVQGSGPHDRNETIGPNRPFQDIAWGLASRGIAVLRYEKRTKAHASAVAAATDLTTREEVTDDAHAAVALLRARPEVDPARVFVLGHSLGGTLAPRIAKEDPSLAGIVVMAGATRPIVDLMVEQTEYLVSLGGTPDAAAQQRIASMKADAARARTAKPGGPPVLGAPASYWADLNGYDAAGTAAALKMPVLVLQGLRDYQVTGNDLAGWRKALASRKDVAFATWPELNHLFMAGEGKSTPAEYDRAGHVDGRVIARVAEFVNGGPGSR